MQQRQVLAGEVAALTLMEVLIAPMNPVGNFTSLSNSGNFSNGGTALVIGAATFSTLVNVYGDLNMHTANIQQIGTAFSVNLKNTGTLSNVTLSNVGTADFTGTTNLRATTNLIGAEPLCQ
jgi:hypothetical protein